MVATIGVDSASRLLFVYAQAKLKTVLKKTTSKSFGAEMLVSQHLSGKISRNHMHICNVLIYVPLQSLQIVTSFVGFIGVVFHKCSQIFWGKILYYLAH